MATPTKQPRRYRVIFWLANRFGYDCLIYKNTPDLHFAITFMKPRKEQV